MAPQNFFPSLSRMVTFACFASLLCLSASEAVSADRIRLKVAAQADWTTTGIEIQAGAPMTIWARGQYSVNPRKPGGGANQVSPYGTFHFVDSEIGKAFPLPAAGAGPAPCYCLIGRIGQNGTPFYVGETCSKVAQESGTLFLTINDYNKADNTGELEVVIETGGKVYPVASRRRVAFDGATGTPAADTRVVVFYVDGLRPDVVREMAAMGHLPNIQRVFLDGGSQLENSLTVFPSDTITANGTLWTGVFSDRHGIKSQVGFNRRLKRSENYLGKFGPVLNDLLLQPKGLDRLVLNAGTAVTRIVKGSEAADQFHNRKTSETPTLQTHLIKNGKTMSSGVMPLMSQISPELWTRYLADEVPYFGTHLADRYVDEANTSYAIEHLFEDMKDVTIIWLPENDTVSHHEFRGAFGMARRSLAEADQAIGQMVNRLDRKGLTSSTYFVLISDHGHIGGRQSHLERFDITNEFFHQPADIDGSHQRVGGGLGLTVRQDRYINRTQGDHSDDFVFIDAVADGVARVSLPRGSYGSRDWSGPNDIQSLFRYPIRGLANGTNLFEALKAIRVDTASHQQQAPIDLVLAKIDADRVLLTASNRGYAVIARKPNPAGGFLYRYSAITDLKPDGQAMISWNEIEEPTTDPLLLAGKVNCCLFNQWHDEETWLRITLGSLYPDGVVAMARHMLWKPELEAREKEYGVDLVITAKPGWVFNTTNTPGSAHGHPFHETMNNTWFVAGPNIRAGAIVSQPVRSVDVTPTLLDMVGIDTTDMGFDGKPVRAFYQANENEPQVTVMPIFWQDIDMHAWPSIAWEPRDVYPRQPKSVNQPMNFWDLSNLTYNAASVREVSVNRIVDDTSRFVTTRLLQQRSREDQSLKALYREARQDLDEGPLDVPQLQLNKVALGDYTWTSEGNLSRGKSIVSWARNRTRKFDSVVSAPFGGKSFLGTQIAGKAIDAADYSASELRRVGSRIAVQATDRWVLSNAEDSVDRIINAGQAEPATRRVR